jgi:hypothetical protein
LKKAEGEQAVLVDALAEAFFDSGSGTQSASYRTWRQLSNLKGRASSTVLSYTGSGSVLILVALTGTTAGLC